MVTIIMPIYNGEKYLKKSIESILTQSYANIELILINDGSTDNSLSICESYKGKDKRVRLIDSLNLGPGAARNKGIDKATGKYIAFVDADDQLAKGALEALTRISASGDYHIVSVNFYRVDSKTSISKNNYKTGKLEDTYNSFKTSSSFGYVWGKLYKTSFIKENNLNFSEERKAFLEDTLFNLKALSYNPKYYVLNKPFYYYNVYEDSISNKTEDITSRAVKLLEDYEAFLDTNNNYEEHLDLFVPLGSRVTAWSLMKTMQNEFSFKVLYKRVNQFCSNKTAKRLFKNKESIRQLRQVPSLAQKTLYFIIIVCIKYNLKIVLSMIFYISYPIFKVYISKAVEA